MNSVRFALFFFILMVIVFFTTHVQFALSGVTASSRRGWSETIASDSKRAERAAELLSVLSTEGGGPMGDPSHGGTDPYENLPLEIVALWAAAEAGSPVFPIAAKVFPALGAAEISEWAETVGNTIAGESESVASWTGSAGVSALTREASAAFLYREKISLDQVPSTTNQLVIRHFSGRFDGVGDLFIEVVLPDGTVDRGAVPERMSGDAFSFDYQFRSGAGTYLFGLFTPDGESPWDDLVFPVFVEISPSREAMTGRLLEKDGKFWFAGLDPVGATPSELSETALGRLNEIRVAHGVGETAASPSLSSTAAMNARDMAEAGFLTHRSGLRGSVHARLSEVVPDHSHTAELISRGSTLSAAFSRILVSPRYRAGLLDPMMTHMGAGVSRSGDGSIYLSVNLIRSHEAMSPTAASGMVMSLLNAARSSSGASSLSEELALSDIAYRHAKAMASSGKVTSRPEGVDVSSEIRSLSPVFSKIRLKIYSTPEPAPPEKGDYEDPELTHAGVGIVRGKAGEGEMVYFVSIIMGIARAPLPSESLPVKKSPVRKGKSGTKKPGSR